MSDNAMTLANKIMDHIEHQVGRRITTDSIADVIRQAAHPDPAAELARLREQVRVLREAGKLALEGLDIACRIEHPAFIGFVFTADKLRYVLAATEPKP